MKESIFAQKVAHDFLSRFPSLAARFNAEDLARAVLKFVLSGSDSADRVTAVELSFAKSNARSNTESIISGAQVILDWPPLVVEKPKRRRRKK